MTADGPSASDDLRARKDALGDDARNDAIARQHAKGKLSARERLDLLLDPDDRLEYGALVAPDEADLGTALTVGELKRGLDAPADGVVTCTGTVDGRPVVVIAMDFTVLGGSQSMAGASKMRRMVDMAHQRGIPLVSLLDGAGHRVHAMDNKKFARGGDLVGFATFARAAGSIPMVAAVMGPSIAGVASIAGMADFVPFVRGTGQLAMAGAKLIAAGTGEDIDPETLGGSEVHSRNGVADLVVDDDAACIAAIKQFLGYLPSSAGDAPHDTATDDPRDRRTPELRELLPANPRQIYDIRAALHAVADDGEFFELKAGFAANIVIGLGRVAGRAVGFMANQPKVLAGTIDSDACRKVIHLAELCEAYGLPILSFIDTPGILVGAAAERDAIVWHHAQAMVALGQTTVPFVSIVLRRGYGGGYVLMGGGRSYDSEGAFLWPSAEVIPMGVEGAVDIAFRKDYEAAPDPVARRAELVAAFYANSTPARAASGFGVDDVIDPADTRAAIAAVLRAAPRSRRRR